MNYITAIFSEKFLYALGWTLLHSIWQGIIVGVVTAILLVFMHKQSSRVRYWLASGSMVLIFALAIFTFADLYTSYQSPSLVEVSGVKNPVQVKEDGSFLLQLPTYVTVERSSGSAWKQMAARFTGYFHQHLPVVVVLWILGITVLFLKFLGGLAYSRRLKHYKVTQVPQYWQDKLLVLTADLKIGRSVKLLESAMVKVPVVIGYFKPVILLPVGLMTTIPAEQLEVILMHELAHVYRKDYLVNILQSLIDILFFYHPVVWWISAVVRQERENCCDDMVLEATADSGVYARALANMEAIQQAPELVMALGRNKGDLLSRVRRLLDKPRIRPDFKDGLVVAGFFIISFALLSYQAQANFNTKELLSLKEKTTLSPVGDQAELMPQDTVTTKKKRVKLKEKPDEKVKEKTKDKSKDKSKSTFKSWEKADSTKSKGGWVKVDQPEDTKNRVVRVSPDGKYVLAAESMVTKPEHEDASPMVVSFSDKVAWGEANAVTVYSSTHDADCDLKGDHKHYHNHNENQNYSYDYNYDYSYDYDFDGGPGIKVIYLDSLDVLPFSDAGGMVEPLLSSFVISDDHESQNIIMKGKDGEYVRIAIDSLVKWKENFSEDMLNSFSLEPGAQMVNWMQDEDGVVQLNVDGKVKFDFVMPDEPFIVQLDSATRDSLNQVRRKLDQERVRLEQKRIELQAVRKAKYDSLRVIREKQREEARIQREKARVQRELAREKRSLNEKEREIDRLKRELAREERAIREMEDAGRMRERSERIREGLFKALEDDGLWEKGKHVHMVLTNKQLLLNGKEQSKKLHKKYLKHFEELNGSPLKEDQTFSINGY